METRAGSCDAFAALLETKGVLVLDGAMGTALEAHNEAIHPQLWSAGHLVVNPAAIQQIHREYLLAGADIITTASYQVSYEGFRDHFSYSKSQTNEVIHCATQLASQAIGEEFPGRLIAASVGCFGAHLADGSEFRGQYGMTSAELRDWHRDKFAATVCSGAHIVACETVPCVEEVSALAQLIGSCETEIQAWISFSCRSGQLLNSGQSIEDACRAIEATACDGPSGNLSRLAVGVNCTAPEYVDEVLLTLRDHCKRQRVLVAYPNSGEAWDAVRGCYNSSTGHSVETFVSLAQRWEAAGARVVGGCCRTGVHHIHALAQCVHKNHP